MLQVSIGGFLESPALKRYSPVLVAIIIYLLLSSNTYPGHSGDFGCFPCRCQVVSDGAQLQSCGLAGVLRLKDISLSEQGISSILDGLLKGFHFFLMLKSWYTWIIPVCLRDYTVVYLLSLLVKPREFLWAQQGSIAHCIGGSWKSEQQNLQVWQRTPFGFCRACNDCRSLAIRCWVAFSQTRTSFFPFFFGGFGLAAYRTNK